MQSNANLIACLISLSIGLGIGYAAHFFVANSDEPSDRTVQPTVSNATLSAPERSQKIIALENQLADARLIQTALQKRIELLAAQVGSSDATVLTTSTEKFDELETTDLHDATAESDLELQFEQQFAIAMQALEENNPELARKQLNKLMLTAQNGEQRQRIKAALFATYEKTYQQLLAIGGQENAALWTLFEMHKLDPKATLKAEMVTLANTAYTQTEQYLQTDNLLGAADNLGTLTYLSKTIGFAGSDTGGNAMKTNDYQQALNQIYQNPDYLINLTVRAENNLYNGTPLEQQNVFWDYTRLASIDISNMQDDTFQEQFVQAAVLHLDHLQSMNNPGDIQSRLDYIRFAFPALMNDSRLTHY